MPNHIILGDSTAAWHNLAMEALLFDTLGPDERRFFLWQNQNTVVIGRHQNAWKECRVGLLEAEGGYLARRSSGGGAVFHDLGNLNFSFIMPREQHDVHRQLGVIRRAVAAFGIQAEFTGRNDLVLSGSGAKFSGNAFRFSASTALHHGTIMVDVDLGHLTRYLTVDEGKLRAKGIDSVRSRVCNLRALNAHMTISTLTDALVSAFQQEYGPARTMAADELDQARLGELERAYDSWAFRLGRALPFDAMLQHRFDWGEVTLELTLKEGIVAQARAYSDAMDEALIARIAPAMVGSRYENSALAKSARILGHPLAGELADWLSTTNLGG